MKWTSTLLMHLKKSILILISLVVITLINTKSYAQQQTQRIYADKQANNVAGLVCLLCGVENPGSAVDADKTNFSNIHVGVGVAGGYYQDLIFSTPPAAGTGAVVKVSTTGTVLSLNALGAIVAQAYSGGTAVGNPVDAGTSLLNLLASGNQAEIFVNVPAGKTYDRIRITIAGVAGIANNINVYGAYYLKPVVGNVACDEPVDELHGIAGGIAALGAIVNPANAIDGDITTYSTLNASVSLAGYAQQTVIFPGLSAIGDSVRLIVSAPQALLSAQLLSSINVETFNGPTSNGVIVGSGGLLNVRLLSGAGNLALITFAPPQQFDRVQLRLGGVLSVLASLNLHEVTRLIPTTVNINGVQSINTTICGATSNVTLSIKDPQSGATYSWYTQATGGTAFVGQTYTPATVTGTNTFYVEATRTGCSNVSPRTPIVVNINVPLAPAAPGVSVCAGSTATLAVTTPVVGNTYNWYTLASGGTAVSTGPSFTTPALSATTVYYVETVNGTCTSPTRTQVTATVNPLPAAAQVSSNNITIGSGQTATLQASADAGNTINWYSASTGGILLSSGTTFTTPALTTTTTYYVETQSALGCISATRVPVTVTVSTAPGNPNCYAANSQESGINGLLCLLCGIDNPTSSVDADLTNFTTIKLAVGVAASGHQTLIFGKTGVATDSIRLDLATPVGLADLGVLNGITVKVMMGTSVVKTYTLNQSLLNLQLLSGNRFTATLLATAPYDRVDISFGGLVNALSNLNIYGASIIAPSPTIAATGLSTCSGSTSTLTATPNGGTTLKWYAASTGGPALASGNTFTTPVLTANTTYYIEVLSGTCANPQRIPVTVTINPAIVFATTTLVNAVSASPYSKQLNLATGGTPAFTYALAPGSTLPAGLSLSAAAAISGTPTVTGDFNFSVIATDSKSCIATAAYTLKVTAAMAIADKTFPNGIVGTIYPTQTLPTATGGTGPYTYTATNLPLGLTFNPTTLQITGTPTKAGTYTIPVTVTDANGNTISKDYTIIVRDPLVLPTATLADGITGTPYVTQTIPQATGGSGTYTYTATGLPTGLTFDPVTHKITGTPTVAGNYPVQVKVVDGDGTIVNGTYNINVTDPLVLPAKILADGTAGTVYATQTLTPATGGTGPYTYVATGTPTGLTFDPLTLKISGTPTQSGSSNITVTVTDTKGKTATQTYVLKVNGVLVLPTATLPDGVVATVYTPQTLPAVTGGTSPYTYTLAGLPNGLVFDPATRTISGTPAIGGTYTLTMTATDNTGLSTHTDYALKVNISAPTIAAASTCSGSSATLTIINPVPGATYNWYAATGNTSVFTGNTYTTPALSSSTTFYAEAVSGTAVSTRTSAAVTVNPAPNPANIATNSTTISSGQTATLQASADAGNTINWYSASTGGILLSSGTTFTTPALTTTTTYYVETQSALGCISATRVPVTVTVSTAPGNPNCYAANSQESGVNALLCVLCGIDNPTNSVDADPTNFTTIKLAVGVAASGHQTLIFGKTGVATDSIRLDLATPVGLADLGVLNGITVKVMMGTSVVKTYTLNQSLLNLQLLSGNRFTATLLATAPYDRVDISYGGLVNALSNLNIYGASIIAPNPTVAATGLSTCSGSTTTLTATANGGTTLKWYASANSGTALASGNTFTTPALTANTTYYIEVLSGTCANPQRIPVTVTINPVIAFATTTLVNAVSASPYSKQLNLATGGTPAFTYALAPGSTLPAGLSLSAAAAISGTPTATGDFNFSVIATDSKGCIATAAYTLKVTAAMAIADKTFPIGIVGTIYPTQTLPTVTGGTGPYTYTATNLPLGLTFNPTTLQITGTPTKAGTYTIPVTVTDANGNTISKDYTIIVRDPLILPTATLADGITGTPYVTQTIPQATGGSGTYTYTATGLPNGLTFDPVTHKITGTPTLAGNYPVQVKVVDGDGTIVNGTYNINVTDPLVLPAKILADGTAGTVYATQTLTPATGGTGPYTYVAIGTPAGLTFDPLTLKISGTPTQSGSSNITVTVTDTKGKTATQTYVLKVNGVLVLPTAVLPDGLVATTYTPQTLPAVTGGTSPYTYALAGLPNGLVFDPATRTISGTPAIGGTYTLTMTATDNTGLSTHTDYALKVNISAPTIAAASTCSGSSATLTIINPVPGATYNWYAATGNTSVFTGNTYTTPALSSSTTFYAEAVSGTAVSTRTSAAVTVNPAPNPANIATNSTTISSGQTATLQASADAGNTINWYSASTGGILLSSGTTFTTPALTTTTTYYVETQSAQGCVSATRVPVTVTVSTAPGNPNCYAANSQESGVNALLCVLCGIDNPTSSVDADPTNFTTIKLAVGVAASGHQTLIFGKTGVATDSIRLDLATPVGLADLGVLSGITVKVMMGTTVVKTYNLNPSLLNLQLLSGNRFTATLLATAPYDRVDVSFGGLVNALSSLNIYGASIIAPNPTVAATGQTICSGSTTTLTATANGGTNLKWYASANSGTVLASGNTFTTPALTATTTYYIEVLSGTCANPQRIPVTVTVTPVPVAPPLVTATPVCSGSTTTLTVTNPVAGITYNWFSASTGGTVLSTGTSFTTPALSATTTYYVEAANGNCTSSTRTAVNVTVNPLPALATVTTNNASISSGQTITLAATAPAGTTINWYAAPTGGIALTTGSTFTTPALTATTTYYVETANATGCVSATRVPVTVTVIGGPANPNCNAANSQESGIDGICVLCTVQDPGNSTDNNFTNYTTISLPLGVGGSGYQRLIFSNPGAATDSIRLNLETPTGLADVTLLGGIQVKIMNGTALVKTYTLSASLLNLQLLNGNKFAATLPATGIYDRVEVRAMGLASVLVNLRIYGAEVIYPNPTVSATGQTICAGSATTLSAAANGGTTLRWYSAATGGTLLQTGENFVTPILTANTTYYIEVSKGSCANATRVPVKVTVTTAPAPAVVAAVPPVCSGSSASIPVTNPLAGTTYNWYTASTGGTSIFTGPVFTTPALTAATTYYVEAANGNCTSATRTAVNVTVNPLPVLPQVQASATTVNPGQTVVLTATSPDANVTFNWYTAVGSTTPVFTGPVYVTPPLTVTTTYYLEAVSTLTGCSAPNRVQVTINVTGGGSPNPVLCEAATTEEHGVTGVALLSGVFNPQLAVDNDTQTASSLVMPVGLLNASVYQRLIFNSLSNVGDTVKVLLSAPGKLLSLGVLANIKVGTYNNNTDNNDGVLIGNNFLHLELLSGNTEALLTFVPTKQFNKIEIRLNSGVAGLLTTVDVNYGRRIAIAPAVAAANVTVCLNAKATLTVTTPLPGVTYKWYDAAGNYLGNDGPTFTTPVITADTKFFVEAYRGNCGSSRTTVNVTVTPAPSVPVLLSPTENTCVGSSVSLKVQSPQTGVTYNWYKAGVLNTLQHGPTFNDVVTANVVYAVEAVNTCGAVSAQATVSVIVGSLTPPVLTPPAVTVNSGEKAVLVANSSTTGLTYSWYKVDPATPGATPISTPTNGANGTFITDPLTATTTFYVTAQGALGTCVSGTASVVVTVNTVPPNPGSVPCEGATTQTNSIGGVLAVLAGVNNPNLAVDDDINTSSSLFIAVGVGGFVSQKVNFVGPSTPGDQVKLRLTSPGKLLSLAVVPSITVTTYYKGATNNDEMILTNPLISLQLLSGNSEALVQFTPAKPFDAVELKLNSGLVGLLTSVNLNYAQRIIAPPSVLATTATACAGSSATLSVQNPAATGTTYKWYKGTTYLTGKDGVTLNTDPALTAGSYDYFVSAFRNGCESAKTKVTVTILAAPDAPVAAVGNPLTTCLNTPVTLKVNPVVGVTFKWYDALTAGNLLATNTDSYTTAANLSVGAHDFYVEAVNGNSCTSTTARTKITLTVNPSALASDIAVTGDALPFCAGTTATLKATSTTVTAPIFTWYTDAALTKPVFTGAVFITPALTATTTYYVTVTGSNKCTNTAADAKVVTLTVNPPATAADLSVKGAELPFCANTIATLTASSTTVTNPVFTWYTDINLTNAVFTGPEFKTPALTASTTYYVTVKGDNKCSNLVNTAEVVTITVNPPALASDITVTGDALPFCAGTSAALTATSTTVTNPVFTWYSDAALTKPVFTGKTFNTPALTGTVTYYVTVSGANKCENTAATAKAVTITVNPPATAADVIVAGKTTGVCAGSTTTLTASSTTVTNPVFTWYSDAALTKAVFTGSIFVTPALTADVTYYVTVRGDNKCENTAATAKGVAITVNPPATAADITVAGKTAGVCSGTTTTLTASSTTVTNPIFTWYSDAALTKPVFTGAAFITPALTANTTYYVTVRGDNKCENTAATAKAVTITVNPPATAADIAVAGKTIGVCAGTTTTLTASSTTVTNPIFTWYSDAALTNAVFTGAAFITPALTANTTYYVTVRGDNRCDNTAATAKAVTITVNPPATAADVTVAGKTTGVCAGTTTTLTASSTTVTNPIFTWYSDAALTTVAFTGPIFVTPALTTDVTYYVTVRGDNRCENTAATAKGITITVNPPANAADIAVAGKTAGVCAGTTTTLTASSTTVTNPVFTWYTDAALTKVTFTGSVFVTPVLTATTTYYVTVRGDNKCENTAATVKAVTITVNPPATAADVTVTGKTAGVCAGTTTTLNASSTTVTNPIFTWYSDAALTTVAFTGPVFVTPVLTADVTYYVTVRGDNKCENTAATAKGITITVNPPATAADVTVTGKTAGVCEGSTTTLTASSTTVTNPIFTWYSDAALTTVAFTGPVFVTPALTADVTYYVTVRGDNRCENTAATAKGINITVNPPATAADVTVTGKTAGVCEGATTTLTASSTTVTNPVFTWYSDAALTTVAFTGPVFVTPALTADVTYYVTVRGDNRCENTAATAKGVTITVNPPATAADVTVTGKTTGVCAGTTTTLTASSTTVTNPVFTWYSDAALTTVAFTGPVFVTPALTADATYYVTVRGDNKCENTAATAKGITITVNPPATAADVTVTGKTTGVCAGTTTTLTASSTTVTNPVFTWYSDAALTTVAFTGPVFVTPVLTADVTYYVTVRGDNRCENTAATAKGITITVNPPATAADVTVTGKTNGLCAGTTTTLTASSTTVTNPVFTWYSDAALTTVAFTGPVFVTPALTADVTYYVTVRGDNRCENTAATAKGITITVNPPATAADVNVTGTTDGLCAGMSTVLTASSTTVTNPVFTWYSDAALTTVAFTGPVFTTPVLTTTTTYYVTVRGDNRCENTAATAKGVTITVNPTPEAPKVAAAGLNICSGESTMLNIEGPQPGVTYNWYAGANGGAILTSGTSFTTPVLNSSTDYYVEAVSASGCGNATGRVKVTVTVSPKPDVPTVASASVNTCLGSTAVLSVSNPQTGITYNWYTSATGGTKIGTGADFTTPVINANTTFYVEAASASCISTSRTAVNVVVFPAPNAPTSIAGAGTPSCAGGGSTLTINNPDPALTYRWYSVQTGGTPLATGTSFTTPALSVSTTYYVESVSATGCASATRTPIVVNVLAVLSAPVVTVQSATATSITFAWAPVAGATSYEVSIDGGITWVAPTGGPTGTTYLVSGLKPTMVVNIRVRAKGQLDCQTSAIGSIDGTADNPLKNGVFIPNTFTPNGDGRNDVFYVYGNTIAKVKLRIYNQWGQFIYESLNIQNGWDGTYKGQLQPNGVYVYTVDLEFNDGTTATKKGTITLLR